MDKTGIGHSPTAPVEVLVNASEDQIIVEQKKKKKAFLTQPRTHGYHVENRKGQQESGDSGLAVATGGNACEWQLEQDAEELDKVYPLPDGWPRLHNKIFRFQNLFFRKPLAPSIAKAAEHLKQLQHRIEAWSHEVELEIISRHSDSSRVSSTISEPYRPSIDTRARKMIRFEETPGSRFDGRSSAHSSIAPSTVASVQDISIHGIGAVIPQGIPDEEIPHLGAEEVIEEAFNLMGRLETDRADTVIGYDKEQKRVEWLQKRIDQLAVKRMHELPKAVQKEHEACATDIAELKWHCSYRSRQLNRVRNQMEVADVLNKRLKEDIAFVQKHCPLVEEKLDLEREAMKRIDEAQDQTTVELNKTIDKLHRTENKFHEANGKADMERNHIKKELDSVREALKQISVELEQAKAMYASHVHTCGEVKKKLKANAEEKIVLETQNDNARAAEKLEASVVKKIQDEIVVAEFQHRKLADHNYQLTHQTERMRNSFEKIYTELKGKIKVTLADLRARQERCREMKMEIEDTEIKLKDCKRQRIADSKNMDRISREMKKVEQQLTVTEEEHEKIKVINTAIKNKLLGEEDKAMSSEESLKGVVDTLKRQLKEETHSRTVMQSRITSDTTDLAKQQIEVKKKKVKVSKKAKELEQIALGTLSEVQVLRKTHTDRVQTSNELETLISAINNEHKETEEALVTKKKKMEPKCKALEPSTILKVEAASAAEKTQPAVSLQEEDLKLQKRLDYMMYRTDLITKKLADKNQSTGYMNRVIKATEEAIAELNVEMKELDIQLEVGKQQAAHLKAYLNGVEERETEGDSRHLEHMMTREMVLTDEETELKKHLSVNKDLAHTYRIVQNEFYEVKNELLDTFEHRVGLESSLKDHKQLNGLQLRLHQALARYYYIRGLYNTNELARFDEISVENSERINTLQGEMDTAIETISKFLTDQIDGTAARMVAAAARSVLTGKGSTGSGLKGTSEGRDTSREANTTGGSLVRESTMVGATTATRQPSRVTIST